MTDRWTVKQADSTIPRKHLICSGINEFNIVGELQFCILSQNQRTEGPKSRTDGETLIFWD